MKRKTARRKKWTSEEAAALRRAYADTPNHALAGRFGRTMPSIWNKAHRMGLKKSAHYLASQNPGLIKPGNIPWNKGKHFDAGGRSHEARFKKGNLPHTHLPVGSERIAKGGYVQCKISDTRDKRTDWRYKHVLIWEAKHGPVPKGHIVVFRDKNKQNTRLANLELISQAENMRRNTIHNYPPALKHLIRLNTKLRKTIEEKS